MLAWSEAFGLAFRFGLNLCLMLDLVRMITRPFDEKSKQMQMYYASSILGGWVFATWLRGSAWLIQTALVCFVILAAYSINFARVKLSRAGFSKAVRELVKKRHANDILIFIATNLHVLVCVVVECYGLDVADDSIWRRILYAAYLFQGIITPVQRLNEPSFRAQLRHKIFGASEPNAKKEPMMPLFLCLASSLNVELVYIILKGIQQFSHLSGKDAQATNLNVKRAGGNVTIHLDHIEIRDFQKWSRMTSEEIKDVQKDNLLEPNKVKKAMTSALLKKFEEKRAEHDIEKIPAKASVTFHRMETFTRMFKEVFTQQIESFRESLSPENNRDMVFKAGEGSGRSGSFFFFSHDKRWIIKTMTDGELGYFLKRIDAFCAYFQENKRSQLAKIMGVFTVSSDNFADVHVVLMENTMQLRNPEQLKLVFDLKGSTHGRRTKKVEKPSTTLKDVNFEQMKAANTNEFLLISRKQDRSALFDAIRADAMFLRSQGLIDYSLLLAVEADPGSAPRSEALSEAQITANLASIHWIPDEGRLYHVSVIDYLQEYTVLKWAETKVKTLLLRQKNISCIHPLQYGERFINWMEKYVC